MQAFWCFRIFLDLSQFNSSKTFKDLVVQFVGLSKSLQNFTKAPNSSNRLASLLHASGHPEAEASALERNRPHELDELEDGDWLQCFMDLHWLKNIKHLKKERNKKLPNREAKEEAMIAMAMSMN